MLDLPKHILKAKTGDFDRSFLEEAYQQTLVQMLRKKQAETSLRSASVRPSHENIVSIMDALKKSLRLTDAEVRDKRPAATTRRTAAVRKPRPRRGRSAAC
jgi:DNA end-binding protein Ku